MLDIEQLFSLKGRVALVSGASSGLGVRFAQTLAHAGAAVVCAARRVEPLEDTVQSIREAGGEAVAITMDVSDRESIGRGMAAAAERYGAVDILVNNAGISGPLGPLHEMAEADWDRIFAVNTHAAWILAKDVSRRLIATGKPGSIINIISILGLTPAAGNAAYPVTKAATLMLTRELALNLCRHKIRVNAIAPGYFRTEMNASYLDGAHGAEMVRQIPMRRTGRLSELDGVLLLLASDASSFITGSVIVVDGGHSSRLAGH
jgi:NAD(P)-dependent dehydrogenase (short-subunit alcohol dehydrogenase family)